jgi:hypothetical protein
MTEEAQGFYAAQSRHELVVGSGFYAPSRTLKHPLDQHSWLLEWLYLEWLYLVIVALWNPRGAGTLMKEAGVDLFDLGDMAVPGVVLEDVVVEAVGSEGVPPGAAEVGRDGFGKVVGLGAAGEEAAVEGRKDFGGRADGGADDGEAAGEGFGGDEAEAFEGECGQDKEVGGLVVGDELIGGDEAGEADMAVHAGGVDELAESGFFGSGAADDEAGAGVCGDDLGHGLDKLVEAHAGGEPPDGQENLAVFGQSQRPAHVGLAGNVIRQRVERVGIGSAGGFDDFAGGEAEIEDFLAELFTEDNSGPATPQVLALHSGPEGVFDVHCGKGGSGGGSVTGAGGLPTPVFQGFAVFDQALFVPGAMKRPDVREAAGDDLEGADRAVGKVGVGDVEVALGEQLRAGFAGGFDVPEWPRRGGKPHDPRPAERGLRGSVPLFRPHEERHLMPALDQSPGKLPCHDPRAAGMVFKH